MRYQIWNRETDVCTPSGEVFTPEQWIGRYGWINIPTAIPVIAGGLFNGGFIGELNEMKSLYEKQGADFSECTTNEEVLTAIEEFEDLMNTPVETVSVEERIASALEAQVLLSMPDEEEEV